MTVIRAMKIVILCVFSVLTISPLLVAAEDRIIGLLTLPQVFGNGACDRFEAETIAVYKRPEKVDTIGTIQVEKQWQFPVNGGGCSGLKVTSQHREEIEFSGKLPTKEFDYEFPAAIVVEIQKNWFRIKLFRGTGWVHASSRNSYLSLEKLLLTNLVYFTDSWDSIIYETPAKGSNKVSLKTNTSVNVLAHQWVNNKLWIKVKFPAKDACGDVDTSIKPVTGWIPAHSKNNRPNLWFYSRGC